MPNTRSHTSANPDDNTSTLTTDQRTLGGLQQPGEQLRLPNQVPSTAQQPQTSTIRQPSQSTSLSDPPSSLIQATAVHMQLSAGIHDQIAELRHWSETISKHLIRNDNTFKHDISKFISRISECSGNDPEKLVTFIEEVQMLIDLKIGPDTVILSALLDRLQGDLLSWWPEAVSSCSTWIEMKQQVLQRFIPPTIKIQLINSLARRHQRPDESFGDFLRDISRKAQLLEAGISEIDLVCHIWAHANVSTLMDLKHITMPNTLAELSNLARHMEQAELLINLAKQREKAWNSNQKSSIDIQCAYCKASGHHITDCRKRQRANSTKLSDQQSPKNC